MSNKDTLINLQTRWSKDEKALFAKLWTAGRSLKSIRKAMPDKSEKSLLCMRVRMKLPMRYKPWTEAEVRTLRGQWGIESLYWIARHLRRKQSAIALKARQIGLKTEAPEGWETLEAAARRTGYCPETLGKVLRWAGTTMRAPYSPSYHTPLNVRRAKRVVVEACEVDEAIERWHKTELLAVAARRHGLRADALLRLLRRYGLEIMQVGRRKHVRVWSAEVDRMMAERAAGETLKQGARRHGMGLDALRKYLGLVGFERPNQYVLIPRDVVDRAAALYRDGAYAQSRSVAKPAAAAASQEAA